MFEIKQKYVFDCHNFVAFVKEHYGKEIDVLKPWAETYGNETFVEIDVSKEHPADSWWVEDEGLWKNPNKAIQLWLDDSPEIHKDDSDFYVNEALILWDLCRKDLIPEGKYVMKVWW